MSSSIPVKAEVWRLLRRMRSRRLKMPSGVVFSTSSVGTTSEVEGAFRIPNTHALRPRRFLRRVWSAGFCIAQPQGLPCSSSCPSRGGKRRLKGLKKKKKNRYACALPTDWKRFGLERGGVTCVRHCMGRWERGWRSGRVHALAQCGGGRWWSYLTRLRGCHRAAWLVSGESAPAY